MVVVVMRVTTLKATAAKLPGLLTDYAGLAEDQPPGVRGWGPVDYYLDPDEPPGGRARPAATAVTRPLASTMWARSRGTGDDAT